LLLVQDNTDIIHQADSLLGLIISSSIAWDTPSIDIQFGSIKLNNHRNITGNGFFTMRPAMFFAFFGPIMVFYSMIHWALPENAQI
jgi:hypothetical protein